MDPLELARLNLTSPIVLSFALGVLAAVIRSDLRLPPAVTSLLSTYLLFAIGLKGGVELARADLADLALPLLATVAIGVASPLAIYAVSKRLFALDTDDSAAMAAHYGSVSAVTFTAAVAFVSAANRPAEGFLPALVAFLEVPGIVVALLLAARSTRADAAVASTVGSHGTHAATSMPIGSGAMGHAMREVITGKSVVLLIGGVVIGTVAGPTGMAPVAPLFVDLFRGVLCLFLLDLGVVAGQRLSGLAQRRTTLLGLGIGAPLVLGTVGVALGTAAGLSVGGAAVLGAMAASASYIAAPAAVQIALPDADPALYLTAAVGVTFPFNLVIGIPLFLELAQWLG